MVIAFIVQFYISFTAGFGRYVFYFVIRGCQSEVNDRLNVSKEWMIECQLVCWLVESDDCLRKGINSHRDILRPQK